MFVKSGFISTSLNESFADFFQRKHFLWLQANAEKLAALTEFRRSTLVEMARDLVPIPLGADAVI